MILSSSTIHPFEIVVCNSFNLAMGLKPYLGLSGNALIRAAVWLVVCPTFTCYGYNMSVAGGLLTLPTFNDQFPRMDTINTEGALKQENSNIQGQFQIKNLASKY